MSKDVIQHKTVKVEEKLYNEILNGFRYSGGAVKTTEKITSIQKTRIKNVGEQFAKIKESFTFHNKFINYLINNPIKKKSLEIIDDGGDKEDVQDVDEKEITQANLNVWSVLQKINMVWRWWQRFKFTRQKYDIAQSELDEFKKSSNAQKHITVDRYKGVFNTYLFETLDTLLQPVILSLSEATINIYNRKKVQNVFQMLKEKQETMRDHYERQMWLNGISMAASVIPVIGQGVAAITTVAAVLENVYYAAAEVGSWTAVTAAVGGGLMDLASCTLPGGRAVSGLAKMGTVARVATKAAGKLAAASPMMVEMGMMVKDALEYTVEDEAAVREEIQNDVMPGVYKLVDDINQNIYTMGRRMEDGLAQGESLLLSTVEHRVHEAVSPSDVRTRLREIREANEEARRNSPTEVVLTRPPRISVLFQQYPEVSWEVSSSKRRVQASFLRRFNIKLEGEVPEIRTSESESIKTLNAAFVIYKQNFTNILSESIKPLFDLDTIEIFNRSYERRSIDVYNKNPNERQLFTVNRKLYTLYNFIDDIEIFRSRLWECDEVCKRIYEMRLSNKRLLQTLMHRGQQISSSGWHLPANSYGVEVKFTSNQRLVPIFAINGALTALRLNVKIYHYESLPIFDGTQTNNYIQLFKQGQPLSDYSFSVVTKKEIRLFRVHYQSYSMLCDMIWGDGEFTFNDRIEHKYCTTLSLKGSDAKEFELEKSINENVENLRKNILNKL